MELPTEAWRVKCPKTWRPGKRNKDDVAKNSHKKKEAPKTCLHLHRKKKGREPSILSLATSLNDNCCHCCRAFLNYVKEIMRLIVR
ncbi:uncharacterized protein LOC118278514 isoform X2 [Spodoptera frugiperda]|uniref:Uncharacterized protein LOC118278514 isoform X2 n=1 Tax=Spodoptera frugiperda TaxID=7108 RepID=A0A9R0F4B0_SPOFR|nr:uncharacterized protein LOC118278514 isoform X2 [Spodoptera frugiperda]